MYYIIKSYKDKTDAQEDFEEWYKECGFRIEEVAWWHYVVICIVIAFIVYVIRV